MLNFSPIFLLCSERSGSNLIVRIVDSHPQLCGPPPSHLIRTLALNITRFGEPQTNDADWRKLLDVSVGIMQNQLGVWRGRWDVESLDKAAEERSVRGVIAAIYGAELRAHNKQRGFIKENRIHLFLPYLMTAFPDAHYVWMVRDPRDMALSWKLSANHPGDVRKGATVWAQEQEDFRLTYGYLRANGRIHLLHYEELLQDSEKILTELCAFLGVPYTETMLEFHANEDTRKNADRIRNWENLGKPIMADNSEKFREALSTEEVDYIESLCAAEMSVHRYSPTASPKPLTEATTAMASKFGDQTLEAQIPKLSPEEQAIRQGRQAVIDQINALPIRLPR